VRNHLAFPSAAILIGCATLNAQGTPALFKSDVNLVTVFVNVTDESGRRITDLNKDMFTVYEDGARREIRVFESQTVSALSVALLIDTSLSTRGELRHEREAASVFVRALAAGGDVATGLYAFDWRVSRESGFTRDVGELDRRLHSIKGEAGTCLYDAIRLAALDMVPRGGRHITVVVTDGVDTTSEHGFSQAVEAARLANSAVFSILVAPVADEVAGKHAVIALAADTGGRVFHLRDAAALDGAFRDLARQLGAQYAIGYYRPKSPDRPGSIPQVRVELAREHLTATVYPGSCANENGPDPVYYCGHADQ
jgi:Ca-activated chloride channel homolog